MTNDRIKSWIKRIRDALKRKQYGEIRDTLRRMETELDSNAVPGRRYYDDTDPADPWGSRSGR